MIQLLAQSNHIPIDERDILEDVPNALGYQRILETGTGGYLVRQYIHSSLYDRMRYV